MVSQEAVQSGTAEGPGSVDAESGEAVLDYYRQMVLIRAFELRAAEMYTRAKVGGYCHLNVGEEATVVGLMAALASRDYLFNTYRDHGYALARGLEPGRIMAELFGKTAGVSGGWGGSMHLFDVPTRLMGGYGIVGGQIPPATGAALALSYRDAPGRPPSVRAAAHTSLRVGTAGGRRAHPATQRARRRGRRERRCRPPAARGCGRSGPACAAPARRRPPRPWWPCPDRC